MSSALSWPDFVNLFNLSHEETTLGNRCCQGYQSRSGTGNLRVSGRVVAVKVEADGDLHIALSDATGDKQGTVVCEVPLKPH